jgi:hypothetical protein
MSKHENETGVIVSIRFEQKKNNAAVAFSLLNAVEQEEQDSLAPVEQDSLVPVEAAGKFPAGLV